jgi:DNA-binding NtrC family response regulator
MGLIEAANGGTLFLDEIGELPQSAQARLLRFIQEGEIRQIGAVSSKTVDVRLICATHRDLSALASRNEFRSDLFYRINVLGLTIPPLRQRSVDIASMAQWFAETLADKLGIQHRALSANAINTVAQHPWPGNVRELEHAVERGLVMAEGEFVEVSDMGLTPLTVKESEASLSIVVDSTTGIEPEDPSATDGELSLEDYFMRFVLEHQDSMSETQLAQKLGVSRKCLWERRQRFGLPRSQPSKRGHR